MRFLFQGSINAQIPKNKITLLQLDNIHIEKIDYSYIYIRMQNAHVKTATQTMVAAGLALVYSGMVPLLIMLWSCPDQLKVNSGAP